MVQPSYRKRKIIIAGGTGFLGQLLARSFDADGDEDVLLSRISSPIGSWCGRLVNWDGKTIGPWAGEIDGSDILINLTGRSIDCRHTTTNRREITDSRVASTRVLGRVIAGCRLPPAVWMNASSMALYGQCHGDQPAHDEQSPLSNSGFLEEVTIAWENEFFKFQRDGVRQVTMRISFILGRESGAFPILKKLCGFGLGGTQGSGQQWMSWLHEDDWVGIVRFLCEHNEISGPINLCAPHPVRNQDFMQKLRKQIAPFGIGIPAPEFGVRMGCFLLGSAPELALQSRKVISQTLKERNFQFSYSKIDEAISDLAK